MVTRWIDRQFVLSGYSVGQRTGVGLLCVLPLWVGVLLVDRVPTGFGMPLLLSTAVVTFLMGSWAFWRWFKGAGKTRRSEQFASYSRAYGQEIDG